MPEKTTVASCLSAFLVKKFFSMFAYLEECRRLRRGRTPVKSCYNFESDEPRSGRQTQTHSAGAWGVPVQGYLRADHIRRKSQVLAEPRPHVLSGIPGPG